MLAAGAIRLLSRPFTGQKEGTVSTFSEDLDTLKASGTNADAIRGILTATDTQRPAAYASVVGVAVDAGLEMAQTAALILKYEGELQLSAGTAEIVDGMTMLSSWPVNAIRRALLSEYPESAVGSVDQLNVMFTEMHMLRLDQAAIDSDALAFYARQQKLTTTQITEADETTRRRYAIRKKDWLRANEELGELGIVREDCILRIEGLQQEFMQHFATEFIYERTHRSRLEIARLRWKLIQEQPGLSPEEIEARLQHEIELRRDALTDYHLSATFGLLPESETQPNESPQDFAEAKQLLRRLFMLIHPDRLARLPLTDAQRRQLQRIWHETAGLRARSASGTVLCRSNALLRRRVQQAQQVLEMAGIEDIDATSVIRGESLEERVRWLDDACSELDQGIASLQAELHSLSSNQELCFMRSLLNAPESVQEEERRNMEANAENYAKEAARLEERIDLWLASGSAERGASDEQ